MDFSVVDRLVLLSMLPPQGDITTIKIVRKLQEDLSFSEEEHKALGLKVEGGQATWNPEAAGTKTIEIGPKAHTIIADAFLELDKHKQLKPQHINLYERFVESNS